uniref:CHC2 zinc finger domain-containing protein n=1 Tax=Nonomuraea gerenzanensis TaxID=93944 RepID=UPI0037C76EA7
MDLPLTPVLEHYGIFFEPIMQHGRWTTILCPVHEEDRPSARTNGYGLMCHACGFKGDAIALARRKEDLDYAGALRFLEGVYGRSLDQVQREHQGIARREVPHRRTRTHRRNHRTTSPRVRRRPLSGT